MLNAIFALTKSRLMPFHCSPPSQFIQSAGILSNHSVHTVWTLKQSATTDLVDDSKIINTMVSILLMPILKPWMSSWLWIRFSTAYADQRESTSSKARHVQQVFHPRNKEIQMSLKFRIIARIQYLSRVYAITQRVLEWESIADASRWSY